MSTTTEIEAQILALQAKLKNSYVDPDFTPRELARWDPTLIGTVFRMQHYKDIPESSLKNMYGAPPSNTIPTDINIYSICSRTTEGPRDRRIESFAVLTPSGFKVSTNRYTIVNDIGAIAKYIRVWPNTIAITKSPPPDLSCKDLGITLLGSQLHIPLADPHQFLLDQIFITTPIPCFCDDKETTIDRYPLSVLYNEWKHDRDDATKYGIKRPFYRKTHAIELFEIKKELTIMREAFAKLKEERDDAVESSKRFQNALRVATLGADPTV